MPSPETRIPDTAAYYAQRYGFSALFFCFAYQSLGPALRGLGALASGSGARWNLVPALVLTAFNLCSGVLLLAMRRPVEPPRGLGEVVIPTLATLLNAAYNATSWFPARISARLLPPSAASMLSSALLTVAGWAVSLFALWHLRRSFAVFVQAGELVRAGPYRYVRHPMYAGYLFVIAGMVVARPSIALLLLSSAQIGIMLYRARLEEGKLLATHGERYRELRTQTGLLFPRARGARARSASAKTADSSRP
jgi:protein-S-isoprenylcysteine O-methyltransferase Ste14